MIYIYIYIETQISVSHCWQGCEDTLETLLCRSRGAMQDVLELDHVPDVEQDDEVLEHMRVQGLVPEL